MVSFYPGAAICVVLASEGYSQNPIIGREIHGLGRAYPDVHIFHGGTKTENGQVLTDGGRVLTLAARGRNSLEAAQKVYPVIGENGVWFPGMKYRTDIAY